MSDQQLKKNIDRGSNQKSTKTDSKLHSTPLILSHSKGGYLKTVVDKRSSIEKALSGVIKGEQLQERDLIGFVTIQMI